MKKILIGLTVIGVVAAAIYFAGRTPTAAPPMAPAVAETPDQLPPVPQTQAQFPAVNQERLKRFLAANNAKGPSPVEKSTESEWRMAAQRVKAGERQPANSK